jgi:hypothetical protein
MEGAETSADPGNGKAVIETEITGPRWLKNNGFTAKAQRSQRERKVDFGVF